MQTTKPITAHSNI